MLISTYHPRGLRMVCVSFLYQILQEHYTNITGTLHKPRGCYVRILAGI